MKEKEKGKERVHVQSVECNYVQNIFVSCIVDVNVVGEC